MEECTGYTNVYKYINIAWMLTHLRYVNTNAKGIKYFKKAKKGLLRGKEKEDDSDDNLDINN